MHGPRAGSLGYSVCIATLLAATLAGAQGTSSRDSTVETHVLPALGLRAGPPQKLSAALGIVVGAEWTEGTRERSRDVVLFAEPGISAGRATLGFVTGFGNMGRGAGVGFTAMRTWMDPWLVPENHTLLGGELWVWPAFFTGPRIGVFRSVGRNRTNKWYFTADFGFGL